MAAGAPHLPPRAMMTSDELDWLVYAYLEESGYHHTSFSLLHESRLAGPPATSSSSPKDASTEPNGAQSGERGDAAPVRNPIMDKVVPPGHLIRLLQKALLYLEAEARYRKDPPEPVPRIVGYPIPPTLPLPPLPKYVPPPTPPPAPASAPPAAASVPASKESTPSVLPAPAESKAKGKGKAKAGAAVADDSTAEPPAKKAKKKPSKEDKASSAEPASSRKAKTPAPEPAKPAAANESSSSSTADAPKAPPVASATSSASSGKGKERAVETGVDASGDVSMHDAEPPAASKSNGRRASLSSTDPPKREKAKEKVADTTAPSTSGAKREREKDDLRPPPAKKTAAATGAAATGASDASSAGSQAKRSASPSVPRKSKPTSASETIARAAPTVSTASTSAATTAPVAPTPNKFRITTTTKTVSTPVSAMHSPSLASATNGPPISAAQLAADKRRRGSGDNASPTASSKESSANVGDRLLKVKTEAGPSGAGVEAGTAHGSGNNGSVSGAMGKNGLGTVPKSPTKPPSPLKDFDMRGVKEIKDDDAAVVRLKGHTVAKVQPCAFNPKVPSLLATGGGDSTCRIWDVPPFSTSSASSKAGSQTTVTDHIICKHQSAQRRCDITCVAWDPSGSLLATGSEDGIVRIWTPSGDLHLVLSMHQRQVCSLKWNPMGTMLLSSSLDQTVCLWELSSGKVRQQYATHGDTVLDVDWNDDQTWASASMDKTVHLMSLSRTTPLHRFRGHRDEVNVVKFSPCGTLVASCSDDSTVRVWSLRNIAAIDRDISAKSVKKGDGSRRIDVDEEDGGPGGVFVLEGHESDVHQIAWHPEAGKPSCKGPRLLASCSFDSTAKLWDADAGTCLYTFARASDYVYSIAFEPGLGRYVATGSNDGRLDVYRVEDRTLLTEYTHTGPIYEITWHPHGQQIAVCGQSLIVGVVGFEPVKAA
ncbi:hypothetical protein BMF94_3136 [Rhodotorula taiwanensis]|uniref:Anaphase-promoting complex subunit 4 WD40 domain-containing protein n=1 Tax=Rhodotorula taiwanensis TaxID=741276 RepID=A0A2S5BA04_9BASI|nr:hypothetical protein BMF94_3136 [Rhodotorula taiwanensis]